MRAYRAFYPRTMLILSGLVLGNQALGGESSAAIYATNRSCQKAGLLTTAECHNAFANAEAEFDDNVPVFAEEQTCKQHFGDCTISFANSPSPKELRFAPVMKGVQVNVKTVQDRSAVPVLDGGHPGIRFTPRPLTTMEDTRSPVRQQEAQARWAALQKPQVQVSQDKSTSMLRGTVHYDTELGLPKPQPTLLARRLLDWCQQSCTEPSARAPQPLTSDEPDPGIFSPALSQAVHFSDVIDTRRFSKMSHHGSYTAPGFHPSSGRQVAAREP
jgi:hypothetical protein